MRNPSLRLSQTLFCTCMVFLAHTVDVQAQQNKPSRFEKQMQNQRLVETGKALSPAVESGAASWVDISAAPSDFPIPLFRGNSTKYLRLPSAGAIESLNKYGRQLTLQSKDPAATAYLWYKKYLPGFNYKIDEKTSQAAAGRAYVIRAASDKYNAMVTIVPQDDATGPGCQIQLTASKLPTKK